MQSEQSFSVEIGVKEVMGRSLGVTGFERALPSEFPYPSKLIVSKSSISDGKHGG